jgi:dephospho-CoA kinase
VVVVNATEAQQLERAKARDGASNEQVTARIRVQLPLDQKVARADFVIDNTGSIAAALTQADAVLDAICRRFAIDVTRYPRDSSRVPASPES